MSRTATKNCRPRAWWVAIVSGMASYLDSAAIVSFSVSIAIWGAALGFDALQIGVIAGASAFSIATGALIGGRTGDRWGRRPVFTATMILIAAGCAAVAFSQDHTLLVVGACVIGLGVGADLPVSLATIAEAGDESNRERLVSFSNVLWIVGIIVTTMLATLFGSLGLGAIPILFGHISVVAVLVLLARLTIPESDKWRAARDERGTGVETVRAHRSHLRTLLTPPYITPFLGLMVFYALVGLAAATGGQFSTYLLVNIAGLDVSSAAALGLVALPVLLIGYLWFMKISNSRHRFTYFIAGSILYVIAQAIPAVFGFTVTTFLASAIISTIGVSFCFETIARIWMQNSFPTLLRSTAQGTIIGVQRYSAAILASFTPSILALGVDMLYGFLTTVSAVGLLVAFLTFRTRDQHSEFEAKAALESADSAMTAR